MPRRASWQAARLALAALLVVLAMWTKQVAVFLAPSLLVFVLLDEGRRAATRLLGWLAGWGLLSALVVPFFFGSPEHLYRHLVVLPSRHPWLYGGGPNALLHGLGLAALALVAPGAIALLALAPWRKCLRRAWRFEERLLPWWLLFFGAAFSLPTAILARIKDGGDINSFSAPALFLVVGSLLALRHALTTGGDGSRTASDAVDRRAAVLAVALLLVLGVPLAALVKQPGSLTDWRRPFDHASLPHEIAFRYLKEHPGELWLPRLTAVSQLAEGVVYHNGPGLKDLERAGVALDPRWLRSHLPPNMKRVGFFENGYQRQVEWLPLDLERVANDPELPGFALYEEISKDRASKHP